MGKISELALVGKCDSKNNNSTTINVIYKDKKQLFIFSIRDNKIICINKITRDEQAISMMSQFTPIALKDYPEINRTVTRREYERLVDYAIKIGITNAFIQEGDVAKDSFIPAFDCEGV